MTSSQHPKQLEESLVVLSAMEGDRAAFRKLVDAYEPRILYYIRRTVGDVNVALDILQETWIAMFRQLPRLRSPEAFRVWLYRIARGKIVEHLRKVGRESEILDSVYVKDSSATFDPPLSFDDVELVHVALGRLSDAHREILMLYFLEGMTLEHIAQVMNCPIGTAKSRRHYAKNAFRAAVRSEADDNAREET